MTRRALAFGVLSAAAVALGLTACSPAFVPSDRNLAVVTINVQADGAASLRGLFGAREEAELRTIGNELAPVAFPEASSRSVVIDGNDGSPFLVIRADGVYETGSAAQVSFDVGKVALAVRKEGSTRGTLSVCFPDVDVAVETGVARTLKDGCLTSPIEGVSRTAVVQAVMHPSPFRWFFSIVVLVGAVVAAWVAYSTTRSAPWTKTERVKAIVSGGLGCLAVLIGLGGLGSGPEMGVAGFLSGPALVVASAIPRLAPLVAIACLVVIVLAADRKLDRVKTPVEA